MKGHCYHQNMTNEKDDGLPEHPEGWTKESWTRYCKNYDRKLKRLRREATGDNMVRPPEPDYDE